MSPDLGLPQAVGLHELPKGLGLVHGNAGRLPATVPCCCPADSVFLREFFQVEQWAQALKPDYHVCAENGDHWGGRADRVSAGVREWFQHAPERFVGAVGPPILFKVCAALLGILL